MITDNKPSQYTFKHGASLQNLSSMVFISILMLISIMLSMLFMAWKAYSNQEQTLTKQLLSDTHLVTTLLPNSSLATFASLSSSTTFFTPEIRPSKALSKHMGVKKPVLLSKKKVHDFGWQTYGFKGSILVTKVFPDKPLLAAIELKKEGIIRDFILAGVYLSIIIIGLLYIYSLWVRAKHRRRLRYINQAANEIINGNLKKRIPINPTMNDGYSEVSAILNNALDQNQQLVQDLRQVNNNIAHDLKSPLNRMRSRLEIALLNNNDNPIELREMIANSMSDVDSLLTTFNSLLLMGSLDSQSRNFQLEKSSLSEILTNVADIYEVVVEEKEQTLKTDIPPHIAIIANTTLFAQAISNLLDNAIKYTQIRGEVEVSLIEFTGSVLITISDNGPGIPKNEREEVFDRFKRLDSARQLPGVGLGMSLVRSILSIHKATIQLHDNHPGLRVEIRIRKA